MTFNIYKSNKLVAIIANNNIIMTGTTTTYEKIKLQSYVKNIIKAFTVMNISAYEIFIEDINYTVKLNK